MSDTCKTCRWFSRTDDYVIGTVSYAGACMLKSTPPTIIYHTDKWWRRRRVHLIPFPPWDETDFCGEHQPQPKEETR